ncbi:MAG: DUF4440 domain-containing protein [Candidatus Aminicenantes bacterium]|nr:DUF4440 domain-containing protein [Candidatus Aminicenantes bacterium]
MKKLLMVLPLVFLLCFTLSCQKQAEEVAEEPVVDVEADVEAIKSLVNEVEKAFNERNLEAYMATIADDAVYMPPGVPALIGKEAIRNWYDFEATSFKATIFSDEIEVHGDWAFSRAHWKGSWIQKDSGETTQMESKTVNIFRRQPDGSWKSSHAIWNYTSRETSEK